MELRNLEAFLALCDERHFGRAAATLHLTQPATSQRLRSLERTVGARLLTRGGGAVGLTPAGLALEPHARDIVARIRSAGELARDVGQGRTGTLRVGYNFTASRLVLPAALARMAREHPGVDVTPREMRTGPQLDALASGVLDVALVYGAPVRNGLDGRILRGGVPLGVVVGVAHDLASRRSVAARELAGRPCVLFEREQCPAMYDAIRHAAAVNGVTLDVVRAVDDPGAAGQLAASRQVVAFASVHRGESLRAAGIAARTVPLVDPEPTVDLWAVWRAPDVSPARPLVETFVAALGDPTISGARTCCPDPETCVSRR